MPVAGTTVWVDAAEFVRRVGETTGSGVGGNRVAVWVGKLGTGCGLQPASTMDPINRIESKTNLKSTLFFVKLSIDDILPLTLCLFFFWWNVMPISGDDAL